MTLLWPAQAVQLAGLVTGVVFGVQVFARGLDAGVHHPFQDISAYCRIQVFGAHLIFNRRT